MYANDTGHVAFYGFVDSSADLKTAQDLWFTTLTLKKSKRQSMVSVEHVIKSKNHK